MRPFHPEGLTFFYISRPAPCPYLIDKMEQMVFTDLAGATDPSALHNRLSRAGFRRSQGIAYRPNCPGCDACVPVRVVACEFSPSRSLRRVERRYNGLAARLTPAVASEEHYALFRRYVDSRHGDGGMAGMSFDDYSAMVLDTPVDSHVVEFRDRDRQLRGVCLGDRLDDGFSLVYSFFEPDQRGDGMGTYMILWHIAEARRRALAYVYMGYWIEPCRKMAYKIRFRPVEAFTGEGWQRLSAPDRA